jgi:uncharacterized protein
MKKITELKKYLRQFDRLAIAFSGGVDSTFLLAIAKDVLGKENVVALTATHEFVPPDEIRRAKKLARVLGVRHYLFPFFVLKEPKLKNNHHQRCYFCKKKIFSMLKQEAHKKGFAVLCDAANKDDLAVYRPGNKAAVECKIVRPLVQCSFTKKDIRAASRHKGLMTWDQPSEACLATRFPYGWHITDKDLKRVALAEKYIRSLGFPVLRLRIIPGGVRIEIPQNEFRQMTRPATKEKIVAYLKKRDYRMIVLDLEGYRSGSMDEI